MRYAAMIVMFGMLLGLVLIVGSLIPKW